MTDRGGVAGYFSIAQDRADRWGAINRTAKRLAAGAGKRGDELRGGIAAELAVLEPIEEFCAYPGARLMSVVRERYASADWTGLRRMTQRISSALHAGSYRDDPEAWRVDEDGETLLSDGLSTASGAQGHQRRPYFEVLVVTPGDHATWTETREAIRRLRRDTDSFVYEPVLVGSLEDALLAAVVNGNLQAVVIWDGFGLSSRHDVPDLRRILEPHLPAGDFGDDGDLGTLLARALRQYRPELDVYLVSDGDVGTLAGSDAASCIRRVFYGMEEPLEIHLSILEGVEDRYSTPYFDNLRKYAQRPVGTFHALPVARGKSIFKSNWIRDMGEFYGVNLFLAESSATTGGLDSLLEPTGNIKVAQDKAARAFGGDRAYFVTNGTSTSNKIVHQALVRPGDIVLIDRDCHKSHHYGLVLAGGQPYYIDAYPLVQYSMYGSVPIRRIKKALLDLKAAGRLEQARMIVLTNCTFDGHVANVERTMLECLAIKPDLVFLWDEAWFGFARFSPFLRRRTAMGAAAKLRDLFASEAYRLRFEAQKAEIGSLDPTDPRLLDIELLPDPGLAKIRVYQTDSVHKSMSSLRQGSMVIVRDEDFHDVEASFKEAYFTHTSTSPNLQIIASLDVARRQMELEGYELVQRAMQLAIELRADINGHPLISRYFRAATPAEMIPEEYRRSGFVDYGAAGWSLSDTFRALDRDEFYLDPTRITLLCGRAGMDGSQFKALLAESFDIQINKTSRNSVLVQVNINNTRSDLAHLVKALADISRSIDERLRTGEAPERERFEARVRALVEDVPDLPDFSRFHDAFRDDPGGATGEGHMRSAYYLAYDNAARECIALDGEAIERRLADGPELVSARFVIPYPPGFPIMVPGQVITRETIDFMRKLDVGEIHGYNALVGLEVLKPEAMAGVGSYGRTRR